MKLWPPISGSQWLAGLLAVGLALGNAAPAQALFICATYASTITGDTTYGSLIEATVNGVIAEYEAAFSDNITVNICFKEGGGIASNYTYNDSVTYTQYLTALNADPNQSADDATALGTLPPTDPVDASGEVMATLPNLRALGIPPGYSMPFDSTITLGKLALQNPLTYNLQSLVQEQIAEVLGASSGLYMDTVFSADLFRYASLGVRSTHDNPGTNPYFSIDNGATVLYRPGGNFEDELRLLDVIGYDRVQGPAPAPTPEPASLTLALLGLGSFGLVFGKSRRRQSRLAA